MKRVYNLLSVFFFVTYSEQLGAQLFSWQEVSVRSVIQQLWRLPVDQCDTALEPIITLYERHRSALLRMPYCDTFVCQCRMIHSILAHLFVDNSSCRPVLVYSEQPVFTTNMPKLFFYWQQQKKYTYQQFYALYLDGVSMLFITALHDAMLKRGSRQYSESVGKAEQYLAEMQSLHALLHETCYDRCYARQLVRYHELVALLRAT